MCCEIRSGPMFDPPQPSVWPHNQGLSWGWCNKLLSNRSTLESSGKANVTCIPPSPFYSIHLLSNFHSVCHLFNCHLDLNMCHSSASFGTNLKSIAQHLITVFIVLTSETAANNQTPGDTVITLLTPCTAITFGYYWQINHRGVSQRSAKGLIISHVVL